MSDAPFERWVECHPSRNWIRTDPNRNYGITNMKMLFYVRGPKGAVQWMIGTEWGIKPVRDHLARFPRDDMDKMRQPHGWDLGYHSFKPMYEGQSALSENCPALNGDRCFYDGSGLNADLLIEGFLARGTEWLWPQLEAYYRCTFEGEPFPEFKFEYLPHPDDVVKP